MYVYVYIYIYTHIYIYIYNCLINVPRRRAEELRQALPVGPPEV